MNSKKFFRFLLPLLRIQVKDLLGLYAKEHHILVTNKPQQLGEVEIFVSFKRCYSYFSLTQIKAATNNFDPANKIDEGRFGPVYEGALSDGSMVAGEQLSSKSKQGNREFVNEIGMIFFLYSLAWVSIKSNEQHDLEIVSARAAAAQDVAKNNGAILHHFETWWNEFLAVEHSLSIPLISRVPTIILGMDVSHGSPDQSDVPLIAAGPQDGPKNDLRSRGLCIVPVFCTLQVGSDNGADYWVTNLGRGFR